MIDNKHLIEEFFKKGKKFLNLENYEKAIEYYDKGLKLKYEEINKTSQDLSNSKSQGKEREFTRNLDLINSLKKDLDKIWYEKGISLFNLKRYDEVIECFKKALKLNPENHKLWLKLGNVFAKNGRFSDEIQSYDKALEYNPNYAEAFYNKGIALLTLGRLKESLICFDKAIEIKPNFANAWNNRGSILLIYGKFKEALECFEKAINIDQQSKYGINNRGSSLLALERYDEAIQTFEEYIKLYPKDHYGWSHKGAGFLGLKKFQEALKCFSNALKIKNNYTEGYEYKGLTYINLHQYDEAIMNLEIAKTRYLEKNRINDLERVKTYLIWALNSKGLNSELATLDKKFIECLGSTNLIELRDKSKVVSREIKIIKDRFEKRDLPNDIKDLLQSKLICFTTLTDILEFKKYKLEKLYRAKEIFYKWKLDKLLIAVDKLENFYNIIKHYNSLEEIPLEKEINLLDLLKNVVFLNGDLTEQSHILFPSINFIQDSILKKLPENIRGFIIRDSYRNTVRIDFFSDPPKIYTGFTECDYELNQKLLRLDFWKIFQKLSYNGRLWFEIIGNLIFLLDSSYQNSLFFRDKAQNWKSEPKKMSRWVSFYLSLLFRENLKDRTGVSDGNADHWIGDIPIEDKLIRKSNKKQIDKVIFELYNSEKNQIFREAGRTGFGIFFVFDIREEIKKNIIPASPITQCFQIFYEENRWIAVFLFQAFTKTPSNA